MPGGNLHRSAPNDITDLLTSDAPIDVLLHAILVGAAEGVRGGGAVFGVSGIGSSMKMLTSFRVAECVVHGDELTFCSRNQVFCAITEKHSVFRTDDYRGRVFVGRHFATSAKDIAKNLSFPLLSPRGSLIGFLELYYEKDSELTCEDLTDVRCYAHLAAICVWAIS